MKKFTFVFIAVLAVLFIAGCPGTGQDSESDTYRVIYDSNGADSGMPPTDNAVYEEGATVTIPGNTGNLVNGNYTFFGWNVAPDGTGTDHKAGSAFTMGSGDITLYAKWVTYSVGDTGPAGGKIFYDKTVYSNGWRYLEAAPAATEWVSKEFGAYSSYIGAIGTSIGDGKENTIAIVDWLNSNTSDTHSDVTEKTERAAYRCDSLSVTNGTITYSDWFLPSCDELVKIYTELYSNGIGGFIANWYWSSSEDAANSAKRVEFNTGGSISTANKSNANYVRAVRNF